MSNGADANLADNSGNTPLIRLCVAAPFRGYLENDKEPGRILWDIYHKDKLKLAPLLLRHGEDPSARLIPTTRHGEENVRDWVKNGWSTTALQYAWWDGSIELCKLLTAGREIDKNTTILWMSELLLQKFRKHELGPRFKPRPAMPKQAYQFLGDLLVSVENSTAKAAASLAIAIRDKFLQEAQAILDGGLTRKELQTQVPGLSWLYSGMNLGLGTICLKEAVRIGSSARAITEKLLELGVKPDLPAIMLCGCQG